MLAFWMFHLIKHNKFFLYYAEGKDNHGVVEDHDAEVDTLCYKEIFKQRFHSQITFHNSFLSFQSKMQFWGTEMQTQWPENVSHFPMFHIVSWQLGLNLVHHNCTLL